tara:strand:- start:155 stop:397 length:243 start_codon:yes stop_codon:yes gene_type:complete
MGQMKWIYSMIEDESYKEFKLLYIKCVLTNSDSFQFNSQTYVKSFARSVVKYVDDNKLLDKYNEYLIEKCEEYDNEQVNY